ncbi:MAG: hypothetical protein AMXMBFR46_14760 [Acidimicrobiia bacterium]
MLRRSPRAQGLWVAALTLAIVTTAVVAGDLSTLHRRAGSLGPEEPVVVARRDLPLGATVTPSDVTTRRIHASQQPRGVLHDRDAVVGRVVRVPVVRDAFVSARHLAPPARSGLDGALPEGTRAVRVLVGDGLHPPPGSAVDVYAASVTSVDALGTGRSPIPKAVLVAAGVVVLATAESDADAASSGSDVGVTLLVGTEQAAGIAAAAAQGPLFLALVPPEDARVPVGLTRR